MGSAEQIVTRPSIPDAPREIQSLLFNTDPRLEGWVNAYVDMRYIDDMNCVGGKTKLAKKWTLAGVKQNSGIWLAGFLDYIEKYRSFEKPIGNIHRGLFMWLVETGETLH